MPYSVDDFDPPSQEFDSPYVTPVSGSVGGGFNDVRPGGRKHLSGDLFAEPGSPAYAPGNMKFVTGGVSDGTAKNLPRPGDAWSYWQDIDTGIQYRFAHHAPLSDYKAGDVIPKGEEFATVGGIIDRPHLHMSILDPTGKHIDWLGAAGLSRGQKILAGSQLGQTREQVLAGKIAAQVPQNMNVDDFDPPSIDDFDPPESQKPFSELTPQDTGISDFLKNKPLSPDPNTLGDMALGVGKSLLKPAVEAFGFGIAEPIARGIAKAISPADKRAEIEKTAQEVKTKILGDLTYTPQTDFEKGANFIPEVAGSVLPYIASGGIARAAGVKGIPGSLATFAGAELPKAYGEGGLPAVAKQLPWTAGMGLGFGGVQKYVPGFISQGAAITGLTAGQSALHQQVTKGEVDWPEVGKAAATMGVLHGTGLPGYLKQRKSPLSDADIKGYAGEVPPITEVPIDTSVLTNKLDAIRKQYEIDKLNPEQRKPAPSPEDVKIELDRLKQEYADGNEVPIISESLPTAIIEKLKKGDKLSPAAETMLTDRIFTALVGIRSYPESMAWEQFGFHPDGSAGGPNIRSKEYNQPPVTPPSATSIEGVDTLGQFVDSKPNIKRVKAGKDGLPQYDYTRPNGEVIKIYTEKGELRAKAIENAYQYEVDRAAQPPPSPPQPPVTAPEPDVKAEAKVAPEVPGEGVTARTEASEWKSPTADYVYSGHKDLSSLTQGKLESLYGEISAALAKASNGSKLLTQLNSRYLNYKGEVSKKKDKQVYDDKYKQAVEETNEGYKVLNDTIQVFGIDKDKFHLFVDELKSKVALTPKSGTDKAASSAEVSNLSLLPTVPKSPIAPEVIKPPGRETTPRVYQDEAGWWRVEGTDVKTGSQKVAEQAASRIKTPAPTITPPEKVQQAAVGEVRNKPSYIVDNEGKLAKVLRWDGETPVIAYPGKQGGMRGQMPYEYKFTDQWREANGFDFQKAIKPTGSEAMRDLRAWQEDFSDKAQKEPRPYPMSEAERRREILENRIKRGESVPDKLLAEFPDLAAKYAPAPSIEAAGAKEPWRDSYQEAIDKQKELQSAVIQKQRRAKSAKTKNDLDNQRSIINEEIKRLTEARENAPNTPEWEKREYRSITASARKISWQRDQLKKEIEPLPLEKLTEDQFINGSKFLDRAEALIEKVKQENPDLKYNDLDLKGWPEWAKKEMIALEKENMQVEDARGIARKKLVKILKEKYPDKAQSLEFGTTRPNIDKETYKLLQENLAAKPTEPAPAAAVGAKEPWKNIPKPSETKFRTYGTVEVQGQIAYKIGRSDLKAMNAARKAGYSPVGGGTHYEYWTRGEPKKFRSVNDAMPLATEFSFEPAEGGVRWRLFNNRGEIYSSIHETADIDAARAEMVRRGKKEREVAKPATAEAVRKEPWNMVFPEWKQWALTREGDKSHPLYKALRAKDADTPLSNAWVVIRNSYRKTLESAPATEQAYSPNVLQGMKDWLENKAYIDNAGNYRLSETKKVAPWNKEVKKVFPRSEGIGEAAREQFPETEAHIKERESGKFGWAAKRKPFDTPTPKAGEGKGGGELYSGIPIHKIGKAFKDVFVGQDLPDVPTLQRQLRDKLNSGLSPIEAFDQLAKDYRRTRGQMVGIFEGKIPAGKPPIAAGQKEESTPTPEVSNRIVKQRMLTLEKPAFDEIFTSRKEARGYYSQEDINPENYVIKKNKDGNFQIHERVGRVPLYEDMANIAANLAKGKDLNRKFLGAKADTFSLEPSIGTFQRLEREAPGITEKLWYKAKQLENQVYQRYQDFKDQLNPYKKGLGFGGSRRIAAWAVSQQEAGPETLRTMEVKVLPLNAKEQALYDFGRRVYDETLPQINEARVLAGKQPIPKREDYAPFMRQYLELLQSGGDPITVTADYFHPSATPFKYAKKRKWNVTPLRLDFVKDLTNYMEAAYKHIEYSPFVSTVREMVNKITMPDGTEVSLREQSPYTANYLTKWADRIAGKKEEFAGPLIDKTLMGVANNIGVATLSGLGTSALKQPTSIPLGWAGVAHQVGYAKATGYFTAALKDSLKPSFWRQAMNESNVLPTRDMDVTWKESISEVHSLVGDLLGKVSPKLQGASELITGLKKSIASVGYRPLSFLDMHAAMVTWGASKRAGLGMGMSIPEAVRFADTQLIRTQASGSPVDRAPIQANPLGKFMSVFQTFVMNDFDFIKKEVVGVNGPKDLSNLEVLKRVLMFASAGALFNILYRDVLGGNAPMPEPIAAGYREYKKTGSIGKTVLESAKEMTQIVPLIGGLRYGGGVLGAGPQFLMDATRTLAGKSDAPSGLKTVGKLLGIPGTEQISKIARAKEGKMTGWETIVGRQPGQEKPKKDKPGNAFGSFGKSSGFGKF